MTKVFVIPTLPVKSSLTCFVGLILTLLMAASVPTLLAAEDFTLETAQQIENEGWLSLPKILERISDPQFPDKQFNISDFDAANDANTDSQAAIQKAIDACHAAGGGTVIVPEGEFFSDGPLHLKSHVNLHLEEGATLSFGSNPDRYTPLVKVRWEGTVCWNWSSLIYARGQENVAITGKGTIDGKGKKWSTDWRKLQDHDQKVLRALGEAVASDEHRVFGNGFLDLDGDGKDDGFGDGKIHYIRPMLVDFYECENVLLEGVTIKNSPYWNVHFAFCKNVTARGIKVYGDYLNDDGIDPDSCEDVLIEDCYVETLDDAIAIKAGRDQDAWDRAPCRNVVVRNCTLNSGVNSFAIGSEISGGVENVFVEDCHILGARHGLNFKCNLDRGGQVKRIFMRNIEIDVIKDAMFIFRMDYHGYRGNNFPTRFYDFYAGNIRCKKNEGLGFKIVGVEAQPISRVYLHDITIDHAAQTSEVQHATDILTQEVRINGKLWIPAAGE